MRPSRSKWDRISASIQARLRSTSSEDPGRQSATIPVLSDKVSFDLKRIRESFLHARYIFALACIHLDDFVGLYE
ncbi:MAG: hypothetical protein ACRERS_05240, partial [Methylococcales bacterium]